MQPGPTEPRPAPPLSFSGRLRAALRVQALLLGLILALPFHLLVHALTRRSSLPRLYLAFVARVIGARVERCGTPLRRDAVFLANHVSWLDIPVLAGATGTAFVAKAEVAAAPLIGWLCTLNHTVFVQREARLDIATQINALHEAMADAHAIAIFPEGTTTDGQSLLPFKTAMLKVLEPAPPGVMVQPVLIDYGPLAPVLGWVGDEGGLANAIKVLARKGTFAVRLHFLEPFSPEGMGGRKAIAAQARARLEARLLESLGAPLRPFALDVPAIRYTAPGREAHDRAEN